MQTDHERLREIFLEASEIASAEEQAAFLTKVCGADASLRSRIEDMLKMRSEAGAFFRPFETQESLGQASESAPVTPPNSPVLGEGPGTIIGRYKLLEQIGEGGFGVVYMAEQTVPMYRQVALKIIKLGMDTREVIARFDAERQALALMDHPNVARVLDAGATDSGRPYFVMELVRGVSITEFCDQQRLTPRERIELFIPVCNAAQHAHSKGIIHRDFKPSNILVTFQDGKAVPKVIDFGIAKAIDQRLTEKTLFTRFGQMIGTPIYMSPEHVGGGDIDTRSDIYSLGVILYELLTGKQPFDLEQLRQAGESEMMRIIQEEDPPPPSTRLTRLGRDLLALVAQSRRMNPKRLGELMRGDLDWITMKALHKDRSQRYSTALALAEDLLRHLEHRPVRASPPSLAYRSWKFAKRHRYAVATAAWVLVSLIAGLVLATYSYLREREAYLRAVGAEQASAQQGRLALLEAQRARAKEWRTRQISYASDMALASHALDAGNLGRALSLLNRYAAAEPQTEELRGWEWRYLWQQCQSEELYQLGLRSNSVLSLCVSADGRLAAAGDLDDTVAVWDMAARTLLWQSNASPVLALSPDGEVLVDGSGLVRDAASGLVLHRLGQPPGEGLKLMEFSPDGRLLAALAGRDQLCLWQREDWALLGTYTGYPCPLMHIGALAFSSDGEWLAIGDEQGNAHLFDVKNRKAARRWKAHVGGITAIAISPDGQVVATGSGYSDSEIKLWWASDGTVERSLKGHRAWVSGLAFSPAGDALASAGADQSVCLWNPGTKELLARLRGHLQEVWALRYLADGKTLVTAGKDGAVKVWRTVNAARRAGGETELQPRDFAFDQGSATDFAFTPGGREVLGLDRSGRIERWALPSWVQLAPIEALGSNNCLLASSPQLGLLAVVDRQGTLRLWDFFTQTVVTNWTLTNASSRVTWLGFAPQGRRLVTIEDYNQVRLWGVNPSRPLGAWCSGERMLGPLTISPDGRFLATCGRDLAVYHLADGQLAARIPAHKFSTDTVAFSPDGKLLASGSQDGSAKLWRTDDWQPAGTLSGHLLGVHSLAFSADGRRLATGSLGNESVKVWDLATLQEVLNLTGPGDLTYWLAFSPDGRTLIGLGTTSGIRCWSAPPTQSSH